MHISKGLSSACGLPCLSWAACHLRCTTEDQQVDDPEWPGTKLAHVTSSNHSEWSTHALLQTASSPARVCRLYSGVRKQKVFPDLICLKDAIFSSQAHSLCLYVHLDSNAAGAPGVYRCSCQSSAMKQQGIPVRGIRAPVQRAAG